MRLTNEYSHLVAIENRIKTVTDELESHLEKLSSDKDFIGQ